MEGLPQSENSNYLEKRVNRKWRKNAEFKLPQVSSSDNERLGQPDDNEHKKVWHQLVSSELDSKSKESSGEVAEKSRRSSTEAHSIHGGLHPEVIGQVLITAAEAQTRQPSAAEQAHTLSIDQHVETISREDLLELSSKIVIEGSSLLHMYETHLIGEKALRRLVAEHLRGGNLHEALRAEIVQHEIDFERDPVMRDSSHQASDNSAKDQQDNDVELAQTGTNSNSDGEPFDPMTNHRSANRTNPYKQQVYRSRTLDITLTAVIAVLLIVVLVLAFTR